MAIGTRESGKKGGSKEGGTNWLVLSRPMLTTTNGLLCVGDLIAVTSCSRSLGCLHWWCPNMNYSVLCTFPSYPGTPRTGSLRNAVDKQLIPVFHVASGMFAAVLITLNFKKAKNAHSQLLSTTLHRRVSL